jgi:MSHA biogenesis protein MshG
MLAVSEETGELGAMLEEIALYYQREVDYDLERMTDIIEPMLLLVVAGMVLLLALAVYMPIWSLVKLAHH